MADFRLTPKKAKASVEEETPSILGRVGSSVHALGSLLSAPSRALHGTINAMTGGEGGYGNMSVADATGGIEASRHLVRAGLLPTNNPDSWELHDLSRGVADLIGDPTSWVGVGGLTKTGQGLAKLGGLTKGVLPQIAAGERAILNLRSPLGHALGDIGHGAGTAKVLGDTGRAVASNPVVKAVVKSAPVQAVTKGAVKVGRVARGLMDARFNGVIHPDAVGHMAEHFNAMQRAKKAVQELIVRIGRHVAPEDEAAIAAGRITPSQKIHSAMEGIDTALPHHQKHVDELNGRFASDLATERAYGTKHPGQLHDIIGMDANGNPIKLGYAPRNSAQDNAEAAMGKLSTKGGKKRKQLFKGFVNGTYAQNGVNDILTKMGLHSVSPAVTGLATRKQQRDELISFLRVNHGNDVIRHYDAVAKGGTKKMDRYKELSEHVLNHPEYASEKLFANAPLADVMSAHGASQARQAHAKTVADILAGHIDKAKTGDTVSLKKALYGLGYRRQAMAEQIGKRKGIAALVPNPHDPLLKPADYAAHKMAYNSAMTDLLNKQVDPELVKQIGFMGPKGQLSAAGDQAANWWQQGLNLFKAGVLAFPSSRVRDLVSGGVQNVLHKMGSPEAYADAARLMKGEHLKGDYSSPEVAAWFAKTGLPKTPEHQTEAVRQLVAVHLPREHGILGDLPAGQRGYQNKDLLVNVPGQLPSTLHEQFVGAPTRAITQAKLSDWNPLNVRGVGGRKETSFPPIKASEIFSESTDKLNRWAGFLHQLQRGHSAEEAARRVNSAQINYDPALYSDTEKLLKRNVAPFYSFASRSLPTTAGQLADFGSPTSQLLKAQTRAYGGDPAVPDYILDSSGVPLGRHDDGTLRYLTGLGLMHDPATKMLGQAITGAQSGNFRPLGLNALSSLNPFIAAPIEQAAGVSFSREGEPIANLESNSGRLLANLGEISRTREAGIGPMSYPGRGAVDFLSSMTPAGRLLSTARMATDTRRGLGHVLTQKEPIQPLKAAGDVGLGAAPIFSGLRYTDVSPQKQIATLRKRAEDLAASEGAKQRVETYFPKDSLERLRSVNAEAASRHESIQRYINSLKAKSKKQKKESAK